MPQRLQSRGRKEKAERGRLWKGRERVLYKTARDITSNIHKTDSPAAASSRAHPPAPSNPPPPDPPQPSTVRRGNEVVSILASGHIPRPVV